eukprot:gene12235-8421_t
MLESLGITSDQVYGDVYSSWLRDTHEKNNPESKQLFREMIEAGFMDRQIVLRRQRLGVNVMNSLATALHRSPLTKLDLHGNALRDTGAEVLAHLMRDLPNLTYLDLGANDIGAQGIQSLSFVVAQHRKLSTLILGSARDDPYVNRMTPVSATILLEGCLRNRSIRNLDLSGNAFGMEITSLPGAEEELESIALHRSRPNSSAGNTHETTNGSAASKEPPQKMAATRGGPRQPMDLLEQLLRSSSTLTSLKLKQVDLSPRGALLLVHALKDNSTLLLLDISDNQLPPEVGDALGQLLLERVQLQNNCQLRTLLLNGNNLFLPTPAPPAAPAAPEEAAEAGKRKMQEAGGLPPITKTKPGGSKASSVKGSAKGSAKNSARGSAKASARESATGSHSNLGANDAAGEMEEAMDEDDDEERISNPFSDPEGPSAEVDSPDARAVVAPSAPLLFATLANDRLLQTLEADRCGIDDGALYTLCRSLFSNQTLQGVSLHDNFISAEGVVMLGRSLCRHPCLKKLVLSSNCIEDEGGCALASMLSGNKSLEVLDLRRTWLGDRGLIALGNALQTNHSVRAIYLGDNHFTEHGGQSFAAFLERNDTVIKCELGATSVPHHTILRLEQCLKRNAKRKANAEPDALRKEVVRLHFQKYKVEESRNELEALREKNNEVKRHGDNMELQNKQDQSDFVKRIRELEEQIENYTKQEEKYREQRIKLDAELEKEKLLFVDDMELAKERLQIEIKVREKVEEEFKAVEAELADWKNNGVQREQQKREKLRAVQEDMANWAEQRKAYKERMELLTLEIEELEAHAKRSGSGVVAEEGTSALLSSSPPPLFGYDTTEARGSRERQGVIIMFEYIQLHDEENACKDAMLRSSFPLHRRIYIHVLHLYVELQIPLYFSFFSFLFFPLRVFRYSIPDLFTYPKIAIQIEQHQQQTNKQTKNTEGKLLQKTNNNNNNNVRHGRHYFLRAERRSWMPHTYTPVPFSLFFFRISAQEMVEIASKIGLRPSNFKEFYAYYLVKHRSQLCRRLHFLGTILGSALTIIGIATLNLSLSVAGMATGFAICVAGDLGVQRIKPTFIEYPFWSTRANFHMVVNIEQISTAEVETKTFEKKTINKKERERGKILGLEPGERRGAFGGANTIGDAELVRLETSRETNKQTNKEEKRRKKGFRRMLMRVQQQKVGDQCEIDVGTPGREPHLLPALSSVVLFIIIQVPPFISPSVPLFLAASCFVCLSLCCLLLHLSRVCWTYIYDGSHNFLLLFVC